jgi:hypothetical protein
VDRGLKRFLVSGEGASMVFTEGVRFLMVAAAVGAGGCARYSTTHPSWQPRFGPVLASEVIVGHASVGKRAWLATGNDALVRIDLDSGRFSRMEIHPLETGEHVWGLARTDAGELWTLLGRTTLARVGQNNGRVERRVRLHEPHLGVFGAGRELVFQVMNLHPPVRPLEAGATGGEMRHVWSEMRTRSLPFAPGAVAALNLVSCGTTSGSAVPCWFPDRPALTLTDRTGASREIALEGLPLVPPGKLLVSENPQGAVRDAVVTQGNEVWVLGSGEPSEKRSPARPGGWVLARYDFDGRLFRRVHLPQPGRVILGASADACLLLAWDGTVVEVRP